ncbi:MAG: WD40/YVTN/BNR-like repeat-containing protein [Ramlibacter sp.]
MADTQLAVNTSYNVSAPTANTVTLTLPATAAANDTVSITGTSATPWVVAQNANQSVLTTNLNGNVAPGTNWTPELTPRVWHWITSNPTGQILLAGEASGGLLNTSTDGGATWTTGNSVPGIWISSDMSADGSRMVAVQYQQQTAGSGMYMSVDKGVTWTQVVSPLFTGPGTSFESVTMSADGMHIAAVIQQGRLVISNDAGATWTAATMPGVTSQNLAWRSVDSSADGQVIVAVSQDANAFISTNGGTTFAPLTVATGTPATQVFENWYRVKTSADGQTIALAANSFGGGPGTGVYVSHDRGATWVRGNTLTADYTELGVSDDGRTIVATVSNTTVGTGATATHVPGRILRSVDGGATFTQLVAPGTSTDWRAIAISSDGNKMAAATGNFTTATAGQLYTSLGNRTSIGTAGSIVGGQGAGVTLVYLGNNQWNVTTSSGGPFSIR